MLIGYRNRDQSVDLELASRKSKTRAASLIHQHSLENNMIILATCIPTLRFYLHRPHLSRRFAGSNERRKSQAFKIIMSPVISAPQGLKKAHVRSSTGSRNYAPYEGFAEGKIHVTVELEQTSSLDLATLKDWPLPNDSSTARSSEKDEQFVSNR